MAAEVATAPSTASSIVGNNNLLGSSLTAGHYLQPRDDAIGTLQSNLIRYARSNDRRMVLRKLKDAKFLSYVPLGIPLLPPDVTVSDLEKEVLEETVILNEFAIKPLSACDTKDKIHNAGLNSGCVIMLKGLTQSICSETSNMDANVVYEKVLTRTAKSTGCADAVNFLTSLFGSEEIVVKKVSRKPTPLNAIVKANSYGSHGSSNSSGSNNSAGADERSPISLTLYESKGSIHMTLDMKVEYGLFRKVDAHRTKPWIAVEVMIHERTNLSNNETCRSMHVKTPDLY